MVALGARRERGKVNVPNTCQSRFILPGNWVHQAAQSLLHRLQMVYSVPPRSSLTTALAGGARARQGRTSQATALVRQTILQRWFELLGWRKVELISQY